MRSTTTLLLLLLALLAAGCGSDDGGSAASPDEPVSAPAQHNTEEPVDPAVCERLSRRLVGRSLDKAMSMARAARCVLRVVSEDGRGLPVTEDYSTSRINVRVEAGKVAEVAGLF
jgi:hypothetical protein